MRNIFAPRGPAVELPPVNSSPRRRSRRWARVALPTAAILLVSVGLTVAGGGTASAADPELPRTGWTATATSAQSGYPASNVIDGVHSSYWHSVWGSSGPVHPHTVTIDMKANKNVTGLTYLPRQDTSNNGNIGGYRVEASTTGTSWTTRATGTWADTKAAKTVTFTAITARYVRLVATTEAGNRGRWSSAAEIHPLGTSGTTTPTTPPTTTTPPATSTSKGRWGSLINFPIVPAAAALLPNGKVVTWSANSKDRFGGSGQTYTSVLTPSTGAVTDRLVTNTGHDMFCPGISALADGRILVSGGDDAGKSSYYNFSTDAWTTGPAMAITRAYQSTTTLSDGRVFAIGGSWRGGVGGKDGEIWSPTTGWTKLSGAPVAPMLTADVRGEYRSDNHGWLFGWSGGRVLQAGPSKQMNWYGTTGSGSVTSAGNRAADGHAMNGTAVMYDTGKILTIGGAPDYQNSNATTNTHIVTIGGTASAPTVSTRKVGSMAFARAYHNSVVLPDGKVLVVGGQSYPVPFNDNNATRNPEIFDPATERWTTLATEGTPRTYHSVALLLPDGRVFSGGGGLCGTCTVNHFNGSIFTPPYLLNSDGTARTRPTITSAPTTAAHGATITVGTSGSVSRFSLVRLGTATHTVNTDQRRLSVTSGPVTGGHTVHIPADKGIAIPGYYMLFAMDAAGTPSVSRMIKIG